MDHRRQPESSLSTCALFSARSRYVNDWHLTSRSHITIVERTFEVSSRIPFLSLRNFISWPLVPARRKISGKIHLTAPAQPKSALVIPATAATPRKTSREQNMKISLFVCGMHMQHEISATSSKTAMHVLKKKILVLFKHVPQRKPKIDPPSQVGPKRHPHQVGPRRVLQQNLQLDIAHGVPKFSCSATKFKLRLHNRSTSMYTTATFLFRTLVAATKATTRQLNRHVSLKKW